MVEGPNGAEFEVFDIPAEFLGEGQPVPEPSEAAAVPNSGLTSTPPIDDEDGGRKCPSGPLGFCRRGAGSALARECPWAEAPNAAAGRFDASVARGAFGATCSIVLDELRSQGQDDTALRHWIGQAEHMLRSEEPPQVLLERAIEDLHLVNEREANQRADSEAKKAAAAGDFSALDAIRHRRRMG